MTSSFALGPLWVCLALNMNLYNSDLKKIHYGTRNVSKQVSSFILKTFSLISAYSDIQLCSVVLVTYFHISYSCSKVNLLVGVLVLVLIKLLKLNKN